jgi:KipI family sensor histidine kinase inhibitor
VRFLPAGPGALLVEMESLPEVQALHAEITRRRAGGWAPALLDVVPAARTILLDGVEEPGVVMHDIQSWSVPPIPAGGGAVIEIHCQYDGPDLPAVAAQWGVSVPEAVRIHASLEHEVAFCGFAPGFAYITGISHSRQVARRDSPRTAVPAGSVALGGLYTGIYPKVSPGGWQVIGHTGAVMWDLGRNPPSLLQAGDRVRFIDVTS